MKIKAHLSALALGFAQSGYAQSPNTAPAAPLVHEGISPHFLTVSSKLELGGASFFYAEQEDSLSFLAGLLDGLLKFAPKNDTSKLPENFSFQPLFKLLGADRIKALGASSRTLADGRYHSRSFVYIPEGRRGLLTVSGGEAEPFLIHELAPGDTDLALEFPVNTKDVSEELLTTLRAFLPDKERENFDTQIDQKNPALGLSPREIFKTLAARGALIVQLDREQKISSGKPGEPTFPGVDAALVLERLNWLLDPLQKQFQPLLASPQSPVESTTENGILTLRFRAPTGPSPMDFQPVLRYEPAKNRLIIATRPAFLAAVLAPKDRLADSPEFQQTWQGLPQTGNAGLYSSARLQSSLMGIVKTAFANPALGNEVSRSVFPLLDTMADKLKLPQAFCYSNQADGTLSASNSIFRIQGTSSDVNRFAAAGLLSGIVAPVLTNVKTQADQARTMNAARNIGMAIKVYANDHNGAFPDTLESLLTSGILPKGTPATFENPVTKQQETWMYNPSLTDSASGKSIILASRCAFKKNAAPVRLVVYADGSAAFISESAFESQKGADLK